MARSRPTGLRRKNEQSNAGASSRFRTIKEAQKTAIDRRDVILAEMSRHANPRNVEGMARFGINAGGRYGLSVPTMRAIARPYRRDHELALALWAAATPKRA